MTVLGYRLMRRQSLQPVVIVLPQSAFMVINEDTGRYVHSVDQTEAFFGLSVGPDCGGPLVVVNIWDRISVERWIFTAAHELGHLLLHLDSYDVHKRAENDAEEQEANAFASYFLMPQQGSEKEWQDTRGLPFGDRILKVKRMFRVSHKTVLYRVVETMNLDDNVWRKFQVEYSRRYGKTLKKADEPQPASTDKFMTSYSEAYRA